MKLTHGGDWFGYRQQFGQTGLDFSANVSPLGLPPAVAAAVTESLQFADRYPDPLCRALRAALAEKEKLSPGDILCGNGAAELIFRFVLALRPRRALLCAPTFAEYRAALEMVDCEIEEFSLRDEDDFRLTEDFLTRITPEMDVVFLCQPNNPTGQLIPRELLTMILQKCAETNTMLAVDECFLDFVTDEDAVSMTGMLDCTQLIIFKAFTKLYGMAGLRLGYCMSKNHALLERMRRSGAPWSVSTPAQAAGLAALGETDYARRVRALIDEQRPIVRQGLERLGLRVVPGTANFLLFHAPEALGERVERQGVILRSCANFSGLSQEWYRTAIRTAEENEILLKTIEEALQ